MDKRDARDQIIEAINSSSYRWRTPTGVARATGLPVPQVIQILENSGTFVRARRGTAQGELLFTTSEKYKRESTLGQRLLGALTNRIPD